MELQRCISNWVPMSAYFRCLWSDSSWLPSISRLGLIVPVEGETLEIDSEDVQLVSRPSSLEELFGLCLKSLAQCIPMVTFTNGSMWLQPLFPWSVDAVVLINILPDC